VCAIPPAAAKNISNLLAFDFLTGAPSGFERYELTAVRPRDRIVERSFSSRDQPSRCGLIRRDAAEITN